MNPIVRPVMLCLVLLTTPWVASAQIENLQQASVAVDSQAPGERGAAFEEALERVVVRLTGRVDAVEAARAAGVLESPKRFVQQFRYDEDEEGGLRLSARFDGAALRAALVDAEIPVWQSARPPVLVWLVEDGAGGRHLVDGNGEVAASLREPADAVGIPLLFPLLDLEDQRQVSVTDVTGGFDEPVLEASERYGTPLVLIGTLRHDGSLVRTRWSLLIAGEASRWDGVANSTEQAFERAAMALAERLRPDYSALPDLDSDAGLSIWIAGIDALGAYARAERVLGELPGIEEVTAAEIVGDRVRVRLEISVSRDRAERELTRASALELAERDRPQVGDPAAGGDGMRLMAAPVYRLR